MPRSQITRFSALALVLANLVPALGLSFWGWDVKTILLGYWAESAIVGLFALLKFWTLAEPLAAKIVMSLFFPIHFGGFMFVHFLFLQVFLFPEQPRFFSFGFREEASLPALQWLSESWPFLAAVSLSHGISFFLHFGGERKPRALGTGVLGAPYLRVVPMHLAIMGAGFASVALSRGPFGRSRAVSLAACLILIGIKIAIDLWSHRREKGRLAD